MKILLILLISMFFTHSALAEPVRQPGFNTSGNPRVSGNKIMTKEEHKARMASKKAASWFSSGEKPIIKKNAKGGTTFRKTLDNKFGRSNVNAANTLWSNLNN